MLQWPQLTCFISLKLRRRTDMWAQKRSEFSKETLASECNVTWHSVRQAAPRHRSTSVRRSAHFCPTTFLLPGAQLTIRANVASNKHNELSRFRKRASRGGRCRHTMQGNRESVFDRALTHDEHARAVMFRSLVKCSRSDSWIVSYRTLASVTVFASSSIAYRFSRDLSSV